MIEIWYAKYLYEAKEKKKKNIKTLTKKFFKKTFNKIQYIHTDQHKYDILLTKIIFGMFAP